MSKKNLLTVICVLTFAALTATQALAYVPLEHWSQYGVANHTYHYSARLFAGRHYSASLTAPHRYWNGSCYAPDMDLYVVNPAGQTYRFTRYGNEQVNFTARYTGTYHFYAKPLYGNGTFHLSIGITSPLMPDNLPGH